MQNRPKFLVAATSEKANTYVLPKYAIHNPKVGGSIPPPATNKINNLGGRHLPLFCYCGDFCVGPRLPLRKRFHCASQTLVSGVSVTRRCLNTSMAEYRHDFSNVSAGVG